MPICATVDPLDDFDANDSVHPSVAGYRRIGENVYAWLKCWLAENPQIAARLPTALEAQPSRLAKTPSSTSRWQEKYRMRRLLAFIKHYWRQFAVVALLIGIFTGWLCYESRWAVHAARLARIAAAAKVVPPKVPAPPADIEHLKLYVPNAACMPSPDWS